MPNLECIIASRGIILHELGGNFCLVWALPGQFGNIKFLAHEDVMVFWCASHSNASKIQYALRAHVCAYSDDTQPPGFILNKEPHQGGETYPTLFSYFFGKLFFFNGDF